MYSNKFKNWMAALKGRRYDSILEQRAIINAYYKNISQLHKKKVLYGYFIISQGNDYFRVNKKPKNCENRPLYVISTYMDGREYSNLYIYTDYHKAYKSYENSKIISNMHVCIYDLTLMPVGRKIIIKKDDKMIKCRHNIVLTNAADSDSPYLYSQVHSWSARILTCLALH